jgi:hypothetical protein
MRPAPFVCKLSLYLFALLLAASGARAADADQVARAKRYLTNADTAKATLFFAHPTATYRGVEVVGLGDVIDGARRPVPGAFALTVRYEWKSLFDDTNTSDIVFLFNNRGRLTEVQAGRTTSFFAEFSGADLVLAAVKDELLKDVEKWKDAEARRTAYALIRAADTKGILTLLLQTGQP